jgi:hypothetical protein
MTPEKLCYGVLILQFFRKAEQSYRRLFVFRCTLGESFDFRFGLNTAQTNESQPGRRLKIARAA